MKGWQWNGRGFEPCASVPLTDRGFRYGMSVFESLRVASGEPQFLAAHLTRLRRACESCAFAVEDRAFEGVGELLGGDDGFARIYVTAGDGPLTAPAVASRVFVFIEERERPSSSAYDLMIAGESFYPLFGGLKTGCYWPNAHALLRAQQAGAHEALLINERAELISACTANVFLVSSGKILTPSVACGARAGVIREQVMSRMAVEECSLFVEDVLGAEEIFLTNSWLGIQSVRTVHGRALPSQAVAAALA